MRKVVPLLLSLFLLAGCATPVAQEYQEGHLPGSKNIPMQQLDKGSAVAENKNIPLFVYCYSGVRSRQAVGMLQRMGYTYVNNIGGIDAYAGKVER